MKKASAKVLVVLLLIILFGQIGVYGENRFRFGFKAGYNFSSHWSTEAKPDESAIKIRSKSGLLAGALANIRLSDLFRFQPEIQYVQKGSNQEVAVPDAPIGPISVIYDLQYLEFPIALKIYPLKGKGRLQPTLSTGGYFSFLLKSEYRYSNWAIGDFTFDIEELKKTDLGLLGGAGIEFHDPTLIFGIQYRYSMGFVDLDLPTGPNAPTVALRNYSHMFSIELFF